MINSALVAILAVGSVSAQQPSASPALTGSVINSVTGEPVRKAMVLLRARDESKDMSYAAESDGNGRFLISDIHPGTYSISAERPGFMLETKAAPGAPPSSIQVEAGQSLADVTIKLVPLGVISGRVLDEDGDPVRGAEVRAMAYSYQVGKKQLRPIVGQSSNDQGEFRIFWLPPGTFYLDAAEGHARRYPKVPTYSPTFFPSTTDVAHATAIEVSAGAQLHGFDILIRREKHYSVRGKLPAQLNPDGEYWLELTPQSKLHPFQTSPVRMSAESRTFDFPDVLPGSYVVMCMVLEGDRRFSANRPVEVINADVEGITLNLLPQIDVHGVVRVEGNKPGSLDELRVNLAFNISAMVKLDGTFVMKGVTPDTYEVTVANHSGTYLKNVRFGDEETPDRRIDLTKTSAPITITLGTDVGDVEGSVKTANGDPAVRVRVTAISLRRPEFSRVAFSDDQGKFHVRSVAPGNYKIFAWEDVPAGAPEDPDFRKPYEKQGVPFKMDPNGHNTLDLTAIAVLSPR